MSPKKKTASANTGRLEELLELLKTRILVLDGAMGGTPGQGPQGV